MANFTTTFSSYSALDTAFTTLDTALAPTSALSFASAAYDRADTLDPVAYYLVSPTSTRISVIYGNDDTATITGSNLLSYPYTVNRLVYNFNNEGVTANLIGRVVQSSANASLSGYINQATVNYQGSTVTITGSDNVGVAGDGAISSVRVAKAGVVVTYSGPMFGSTNIVNGFYESSITGTVNTITIAQGTTTATLSGISIGVETLNALTTDETLELVLSGADNVNGGTGAEQLRGYGGNDNINGLAGNDTLEGGTGNDTLNGGAGIDTLLGGAGDDTYVVDVTGDVVTELDGEGTDQVNVAFAVAGTYVLTDHVENATITSATLGVNLTGNGLNNRLTGNAAANVLDGSAGNDTLVGGAGNDTYVVDAAGDVITELLTGGIDTVRTSLSAFDLTGSSHVENLTYIGSGDFAGTGNTLANLINGGAGNDTLDGGLGNDNLIGGAGDDTYRLNVATDIVNETAVGSGGIDTVELGFSAAGTYAMTVNVENALVTAGAGVAVNVTGNVLDNTITGHAGNNLLIGGVGNDTLVSGGGIDTLDGTSGDDLAVVLGNVAEYTVTRPAANDTVLTGFGASAGQVITLRNIDNVQFADGVKTLAKIQDNIATIFNDVLTATTSPELIDGLAGNDTITGGMGNDTLNGGLGNDSMLGGDGDDTFIVNVGTDVVVELENEGDDTVQVAFTAAGTYTLTANVENASITTALAGVNVTGNALDNLLSGGNGANVLNGGAGNDTLDGGLGNDNLIGGAGDDTYRLNVATDIVNETAVGSGGIDTVELGFSAAGTYAMTVNVENALVTAGAGVAVNVTGNVLDNTITGHAGNNLLIGGVGNDTLVSGGGIDTLDGTSGDDLAVVLGNVADYKVTRPAANDTVLTGFGASAGQVITLRNIDDVQFNDGSRTIAQLQFNVATIGNDNLTGGSGNDTFDGLSGNDSISGFGGNDTLSGGLGNDTLIGGDGDDTFIVNVGTDVVVELENEGNDTVQVAFTAAGTYTLSANVENATITTALAGVNVTGNALDNVLTGGNGANVLNGGAGNDTLDGGLGNDNLIGGAGDDTYRLNVATDIVNETAVGSGGIDTVELGFTAAGTYAMTVNVENALVTAGEGVAVNVTGNVLDNTITGHAGNNLLNGGLGNDTLVSNGGTDTLDGAAGNDRAVVLGDQGDYAISRINLTDATFTRSGESITLRNIETVEFGDGVQSVADLLALLGSPTNDNINGTVSNDTLSGGVGNDLLNGGEGDDQLDGGVGNDTLRGGAGTDLLLGGTGADTYRFGAGSGNDTVTEATDVATNIDVVVIDADSGNVADGQARFSRTGDDSNDLMLTLTNNDDGLASVDTLIVTDFFLNDLVNTTKTVEQFRFADGGVTLTQAQIQALLLQSTDGNDVLMGYANTNDSINGGLGNDTISGAGGNDILLGGAGDDVLDGGLGNDNLQGGSGADTLDGGLGNDTLTGGAGDDALTGGAGLDRFVLNSLTGSDTVTDFQVGVDKIALSKSVFTTITAAVGAVTNEAGLAAAGFDYDSGTGALTWDADGAGGEAAITLATLSNNLNLANDFLIIG